MKLCEVCGSPEHPKWKAHTFATNRIATNTNATNRVRSDRVLARGSRGHGVASGVRDSDEHENGAKRSPVEGGGKEGSGVVVGQDKTKNRRSREAYNAYQREYMRKRMAK